MVKKKHEEQDVIVTPESMPDVTDEPEPTTEPEPVVVAPAPESMRDRILRLVVASRNWDEVIEILAGEK
jgi:hypothetical protein